MREIQEDETCHPNLVRLIDVYADYISNAIYLIMEICPGGDLFDIVINGKLTETETRAIFSQLLLALEYLHDRGWIHRDVKLENIVVVDKGSLRIKLADFDLAKKVGLESSNSFAASLCGTPSYVAPEVLQDGPRKYGFPVDMWSAGVVLYICLCGFPPFSEELYSKEFPFTLAQQIKSGRFDYPSPYWDDVGDPPLDLIDLMLCVYPERRPTAKQCMSHPWMLDMATTITILPGEVGSASPEVTDEETQ